MRIVKAIDPVVDIDKEFLIWLVSVFKDDGVILRRVLKRYQKMRQILERLNWMEKMIEFRVKNDKRLGEIEKLRDEIRIKVRKINSQL